MKMPSAGGPHQKPSSSSSSTFPPHLWSALATTALSESSRESTEQISSSSFRLRDQVREQEEHYRREVEYHLVRRIADLTLWIEEFTRKSEQGTEALDAVGIYTTRIENFLKALPPIVAVDEEILKLREGRIGMDLAVDEPHEALLIELSTLESKRVRLSDLLKEFQEMARTLRKLGHALGKQLEDRRKAKEIDEQALSLGPHSMKVTELKELGVGPMAGGKRGNGNEPLENEKEWECWNHEQKERTESLFKKADDLLTLADSELRESCEVIMGKVCATNGAFEKKLMELRGIKGKLEEEHRGISINIRELEDAIDKVEKAGVEKESLIALAKSRLFVRSHRPNLELVEDAAQRGLGCELLILQDSLHALTQQSQHCKQALRSLLSSQLRIEDEINVKLNSIVIDETKVVPLRKTISIHPQ